VAFNEPELEERTSACRMSRMYGPRTLGRNERARKRSNKVRGPSVREEESLSGSALVSFSHCTVCFPARGMLAVRIDEQRRGLSGKKRIN